MTSTHKPTAIITALCRKAKLAMEFPTFLVLAALAVGPACYDAMAGVVSEHVSQKNLPSKIPLLIVLVEYEDYKLVFTDADWNRKIFSMPTKKEEEQRFDLFGFCGSSVNNFFQETTSGKFLFEPVAETCGTPNDGVVRIALNRKHPKNDPKAGHPLGQALCKVSQYVDLARYDLNKDKRLDDKELLLVALFAGGEADQTQTGYYCTYGRQSMGGGYSRNATVVMTERRDDLREKYAELTRQAKVEPKYKNFPPSLGTLVHELGHHLGSPDLRNTGYYDTMGWGKGCGSKNSIFPGTTLRYNKSVPCHYGAFCLARDGLVTPILLKEPGVYTVYSADTGKYNVYKIPTENPKEYFLIENRQRKGFDEFMGKGDGGAGPSGILIWHCDESQKLCKDWVHLERASKTQPFYPFPKNNEFSSISNPNNRTNDGKPQPWKISILSNSASAMRFQFQPGPQKSP